MTIGLSPVLRMQRPGVLLHWCPGCNVGHTINIHDLSGNGHCIGWDGDVNAPSFGEPLRHQTEDGPCGYMLRGGRIAFDDDCWHGMAGIEIRLPEYPAP